MTDTNGSTPKLVASGILSWLVGPSPDGQTFLIPQNGAWVIGNLADTTTKPVPGLQSADVPIGWTSDSKHVFTQVPNLTGITIYKVDVNSGQREVWQVVKPKEQIGLRPMTVPVAITPDGRWMAFAYRTDIGHLYRSDTLK